MTLSFNFFQSEISYSKANRNMRATMLGTKYVPCISFKCTDINISFINILGKTKFGECLRPLY
jgi:hypothetical protein